MSRMSSSIGVSPGNVAVYHGHRHLTDPMTLERRIRVAELVLRVLICGLAALAAFLIATDTQVKVILSIEKTAKFTEMKSLVLLVAANGMMAVYSVVQAVRCVVSMVRGSVVFSKPLAWVIFSGDQAVAYLGAAAVAAALQSSAIAKNGQAELQWIEVCDMFDKYCNQGSGGFASAVVASLCAAVTSSISAYTLFRQFGVKKGKTTAGSCIVEL